MNDMSESSTMDGSKKRLPSYDSFQLTNNEKSNIYQTGLNTSLPLNTTPMDDEKKWTTAQTRNLISNILTLISLVFLVPGLWYPMINVHITAMERSIVVADQTRSILSTVSFLFEHNANLPAVLILIFSVVIPFLKAILLLTMNISTNAHYNYTVYTIIRDFGKWSMADVFVTAVFISYLSATVSVDIQATLLAGFYCFLAYCIISLLAVQIMVPPPMVEVERDYEKIERNDVIQKLGINNNIPDNNNERIEGTN